MRVPFTSMRVWYTNMHAGRSRTCTAMCVCQSRVYVLAAYEYACGPRNSLRCAEERIGVCKNY